MADRDIEGTSTARVGLDASVGHSSDGSGLLVLGVEVGAAKGDQEARTKTCMKKTILATNEICLAWDFLL